MALLDKADNMFGALQPEIKARINNFLATPTEENWNDIHSIIVRAPFGTVWRAVLAIDPTFPRTGPTSYRNGVRLEGWQRIPDAMLVARAIRRLTSWSKAGS